jgi:hypothetical protein
MPGLHSLRLQRPGASDQVLCLTDADSSPAVIEALKVIARHARSDVKFKLVDVRSGAIVSTARKEN